MAIPKAVHRSMIIVEIRKELRRLEARINKLERAAATTKKQSPKRGFEWKAGENVDTRR